MNMFAHMTQADVDVHNARVAGMKPGERESPDDAVEVEDALHCDIMYECRKRGWLYFHGSMAHKTRRTHGEPDFTILANNGRKFLIECKAKGRKRSPAQIGIAVQAGILGHEIHLVESMSRFLEIVDNTTQFTCETCQNIATVHIKATGFHFCQSCLEKIDARLNTYEPPAKIPT